MRISQQSSEKQISSLELVLLGFIVVFHLWPAYAVIKVGALPGINLQRIFMLLLIISWLFTLLSSQLYYDNFIKQVLKYRYLVINLFVYFTLRYISVLRSDNFLFSFYAATNEFISYFLLFLIGLTVWHNTKQVTRLLHLLVILSIIISLLGLYESRVERNIFEQFIPITSDYLAQTLEAKIRDSYRVQATFEHPLVLAEYFVFIIPLSLAMAINSRIRFYQIFGGAAVILDILAMWKTGSRTGIIVLIGLGFLVALWKIWFIIKHSKDYKIVAFLLSILPIVAAVVPLGFLVINHLLQGRSSEEASSTVTRLVQLDLGIPLVLKHPFLGYGPGNGAILLDIRSESGLPTIDNYYLSIALESGFPALVVFTFAFCYILYLSLQAYRFGMVLAGGFALAFVGFILSLPALSITAFFPFVFLSFSLVTTIKNFSELYEKKQT